LNNLIKELNEGRHPTIDTYAKKLAIQSNESREHPKLTWIKIIVDFYLSFHELLEGPDPRYETFFANLMGPGDRPFPKSVKFLNWNYDRAIMYSYLNVKGEYKRELLSGALKFLGKEIEQQELKLNGILSFDTNSNDLSKNTKEKSLVLLGMLKHFRAEMHRPEISYAWEKEKLTDILSRVKAEYSKTDTLIVIGYSFPDSNVYIDSLILKELETLQRVVIQDPNAENIKLRLSEIFRQSNHDPKIIETRTDTSSFFIPASLLASLGAEEIR
jgi:hypothetical protein